MYLGALFARLDDERDVAAFLAGSGDALLFQRVAETATAFEETPEEYVAAAIRRYAARAPSEDWLQLMTAMEKADDPARAAIAAIIGWALAADRQELAGGHASGCSCKHH